MAVVLTGVFGVGVEGLAVVGAVTSTAMISLSSLGDLQCNFVALHFVEGVVFFLLLQVRVLIKSNSSSSSMHFVLRSLA